MTYFHFQAILDVFLRLSGTRHYGEALHRIAAADAGRCAFALFNDIFAGAASKQSWRAGTSARAAHKFLRRQYAPFATARTAPVAPLVGPALLGRRQ